MNRRRLHLGLALVLAVLITPSTGHAAIWVVDSTSDANVDCSNTATDCTLRGAVDAAGNNDTIRFQFDPPSQPRTITLNSRLPALPEGLTIDGLDCINCGGAFASTSSAVDGLNSSLGLTITAGGGYPANRALLTIAEPGITLRGLAVVGGPGTGIEVAWDFTTVEHCYVGLEADGVTANGNAGNGIVVWDSWQVQIGPGVVSSDNGENGLYAYDTWADFLTVENSIFGADVTATLDRGNSLDGLQLDATGVDLADATIGGLSAGNVFAANGRHGLMTLGEVHNLDLIGNLLGVGAGLVPLGNTASGWQAQEVGADRTHGALVQGNTFGDNGGHGARLRQVQGISVFANGFGTDPSGTVNLGNGQTGMSLIGQDGAHLQNVVVGNGTAPSANVFAYNANDGLRLKLEGTQQVRDNSIRRNAFFSNGGLGIDLLASGTLGDGPAQPTSTSCTPDPAWGNRAMARPHLSSAEARGGLVTVIGTSCVLGALEVYRATGDPSGYGEPVEWLAATNADTAGNWSATFPLGGLVAGDLVTALLTLGAETGEAGANVTVVQCDADGDGVDNPGCGGDDCDDDDPTTSPVGAEVCDGTDNDCDGATDEGFDADGDGETSCAGDCDDSDSDVNSSATEDCVDGMDNDCDDAVDGDDPDCSVADDDDSAADDDDTASDDDDDSTPDHSPPDDDDSAADDDDSAADDDDTAADDDDVTDDDDSSTPGDLELGLGCAADCSASGRNPGWLLTLGLAALWRRRTSGR